MRRSGKLTFVTQIESYQCELGLFRLLLEKIEGLG